MGSQSTTAVFLEAVGPRTAAAVVLPTCRLTGQTQGSEHNFGVRCYADSCRADCEASCATDAAGNAVGKMSWYERVETSSLRELIIARTIVRNLAPHLRPRLRHLRQMTDATRAPEIQNTLVTTMICAGRIIIGVAPCAGVYEIRLFW